MTLDQVIAIDYLNTSLTPLIYPNPTHDYLYIQNSNNIGVVDWQITDINGRVISRGQSTERNNKLTNISELNSGIYFIQLFLENRTHVQKIVKL